MYLYNGSTGTAMGFATTGSYATVTTTIYDSNK